MKYQKTAVTYLVTAVLIMISSLYHRVSDAFIPVSAG